MQGALVQRDTARKAIDAFFEPRDEYTNISLPVANDLSCMDLVANVFRDIHIPETFRLSRAFTSYACLYGIGPGMGEEFMRLITHDPDFYTGNSAAKKA